MGRGKDSSSRERMARAASEKHSMLSGWFVLTGGTKPRRLETFQIILRKLENYR